MKYILLLFLLFFQLCIFSQEDLQLRASIDAAKGFGKNLDAGSQPIGNAITTLTLGLVKNGISLGIGAGIFKMDGTKAHDHYIPVYGELSYLVPGDKVSPFFGVKIGKLLPDKKSNNPYPLLNRSTVFYQPSIGLAIDLQIVYLMPFLDYFVPANFNARYDTFGAGLRIMTH